MTTNEYNHLADPIMRELLLTNNGQPDLLLKTFCHACAAPMVALALLHSLTNWLCKQDAKLLPYL